MPISGTGNFLKENEDRRHGSSTRTALSTRRRRGGYVRWIGQLLGRVQRRSTYRRRRGRQTSSAGEVERQARDPTPRGPQTAQHRQRTGARPHAQRQLGLHHAPDPDPDGTGRPQAQQDRDPAPGHQLHLAPAHGADGGHGLYRPAVRQTPLHDAPRGSYARGRRGGHGRQVPAPGLHLLRVRVQDQTRTQPGEFADS